MPLLRLVEAVGARVKGGLTQVGGITPPTATTRHGGCGANDGMSLVAALEEAAIEEAAQRNVNYALVAAAGLFWHMYNNAASRYATSFLEDAAATQLSRQGGGMVELELRCKAFSSRAELCGRLSPSKATLLRNGMLAEAELVQDPVATVRPVIVPAPMPLLSAIFGDAARSEA